MPTDAPALAAVGPRFEIPESVPAPIAAVRAQVVRAVRSLIGQRGGIMLLRTWGSGGEVRIVCAIDGPSLALRITCGDETVAGQVRSLAGTIANECARHGCTPSHIECLGPMRSLQPAA
jgi:hypothetical protein